MLADKITKRLQTRERKNFLDISLKIKLCYVKKHPKLTFIYLSKILLRIVYHSQNICHLMIKIGVIEWTETFKAWVVKG